MSLTPLQSDSIQRLRAWYAGLPHGDQVCFLAGCMLFGAAAVGMLLQPGQAPAGALQANVLGTLNNVNNGLNATVATIQAVDNTVTQTSAMVSGTAGAGKQLLNGQVTGGVQTLTGAQATALANGAGGVVTAVGAAGQAVASPSVYLPNLGQQLANDKTILQNQIPDVNASKQALAARMNTVFDPGVLAEQARAAGQGVRFADPGQVAAGMTASLPKDIGLDIGGLTSRASSLNLTGIADSVQTKAGQLGSIFSAANGAPTIPGIGGLGGINIPTSLNDAAGMAQNAAGSYVNNQVNNAVNSVVAPVAGVVNTVNGAVDAAGNIAGTANGAVNGATAAVSATTGAVNGAVSGTVNAVSGAANSAAGAANSMSGATNTLNGAVNTATGAVNSAVSTANTVSGAASALTGGNGPSSASGGSAVSSGATGTGFTGGSTTDTASVSAATGAASSAGFDGSSAGSSSAAQSSAISAATFAGLQGKLTYLFPPANDAETNNHKDLAYLISVRVNAVQLIGNIMEQTGAGAVAALMHQAGITSSQVAQLGGFSSLRAMLLHLETTGN